MSNVEEIQSERIELDPKRLLTHVEREDEKFQRPLDFALIMRVMSFTKPYTKKRNWLFVLCALRGVQYPALFWLFTHMISVPIAGQDWDGLIWMMVGFFALFVFTAITFYFRLKFAFDIGENVSRDIRVAMFEHLQTLTMNYYDRTKRGWIISRVNSDAEAVKMGVQDVLFVTIVQGGWMVVSAAVMLFLNWRLFLVLCIMAPIVAVIVKIYRGWLSNAWRIVQESMSRVTATLAESVEGIRVTQGFAREDVNAQMFGDLVHRHGLNTWNAHKLAAQFFPMLEFNGQLFSAILILIGGWLALDGGASLEMTTAQQEADIADIITFLFMAGLFFSPINVIGRQYNIALMAMAGAERLFYLLDTKPTFIDEQDATDIPPIDGRVELRNLTFGYNPEKAVLKDINFTAEPGQLVALVGHTGSGKTSIINLIAKFYLPTEGELFIDGHEIRKVKSDSLHHQMGIVLQQNFLFAGTVMENIRYGRPVATDEEVIDAARTLDVLDLIEGMPNGFNTDVGERGNNLSLGQRQIVCFCRAMVANPRIMILDEATSSVDSMTEVRIQRALERLLTNRTSFVVAHRLSTIRHADQVLVLDHGKIIERGTHHELIKHGGIYANLYRQFVRAAAL